MAEKQCSMCKETKDETEYSKKTGTPWLQSRCKKCTAKKQKERYDANPQKAIACHKKYVENNREFVKEKRKIYNEKHKNEIKEYNKQHYLNITEEDKEKKRFADREFYKKNAEKLKAYRREYYKENKQAQLTSGKEYKRQKRKTDINFKLAENLRNRLYKVITGRQKSGSAVTDLGCSIEQLKEHLEKQFIETMNWENYGNKEGQWSIDHIKPLSSFDLSDREQFLEACNYTNLQPLWHVDNVIKRDTLE